MSKRTRLTSGNSGQALCESSSCLSSASPAHTSSHHKTTEKDLAQYGTSEDLCSERVERGGLACAITGLYCPLVAESKPGEVWTGRAQSSVA